MKRWCWVILLALCPATGAADTLGVATAASDTDFAAVAARLTDGVADYFLVGTCEQDTCGYDGAREGPFFGVSTPDLGPATIERITLHIDAIHFGLSRRAEPIVEYTFTVTVEGTKGSVPVRPSSWGRVKSLYR